MKKYIAILLFLSACNLAPNYERPVVDAPNWKNAPVSETSEVPTDWWQKFNSEELNKLVSQSLATNTDLAASIQRIEQARAATRITDAALLPTVDASGNIGRTQVNRSNNNGSTNSYRVGVSVAYELDLFGKNRNNSEAASERTKASEFDHDALALVVTSDTARIYAQLLSIEDRITIARKNLENSTNVLKIVQARYEEGATSGLELAQQKSSLANTETIIANLEQQRNALQTQLALLNGQPPQTLNIAATTLEGFTIPQIAPGQPSALLERRPDIKAAEADLKAANIDIGAARAAYFPSIDLGLSSALAANPASSSAALTTGLIGSIFQPIFEGGAIDANVDQTKARKEELAANYRGVVLTSFKEVEDALAAEKSAATRVTSLQNSVTDSGKAYDIASFRYKEGSTDYQTLLDTERTLFQTQDNLFQAKLDQISAAIDLYKALGGGWKE